MLAFTLTSHLMTALVTAVMTALLVWWICRRRDADTPIWSATDFAEWHTEPEPVLVGEVVPVRRRLAITAALVQPVVVESTAELVPAEPWDFVGNDPLYGDLPAELEQAVLFAELLARRELVTA